jgi:hypothetical protein
MEDTERYLKEAADVIAAGNKTFSLILISALIWWFANLFPFNLSERSNRSLAGRLSTLTDLGSGVISICNSAIDTYASYRAGAILNSSKQKKATDNGDQSCVAQLPLSAAFRGFKSAEPSDDNTIMRLILSNRLRASWNTKTVKNERGGDNEGSAANDKVALKGQLAAIAKELKQSGREDCTDEYDRVYQRFFGVCNKSRGEFVTFVDNWTKEGNIDIVGLKINNINVRWHPFALVLIFLTGIFWLGSYRQRIFVLLDRYLRCKGAQADGWLLSVPWWLSPIPHVTYASDRTLRGFIATEPEYVRSRRTSVIILIVLAAMFASGVHTQQLLSTSAEQNLLPPNVKELGDFENSSLGLFGTVFVDVLFLSTLIALPFGAVWWVSIPRVASLRERFGGPSRRRALKVLGAGALFSLAVPVMVKPDSLRSLPRLRTRSNPYRKRRRSSQVIAKLEAGWYRRRKGRRKKVIAQYVKGTIQIRRAPRFWPPRLGNVMNYPSGRISRAAAGLKIGDLRPLTVEEVIASTQQSDQPLPKGLYSEGIEAVALKRWLEDRDGAIKILQTGLTYADGGDLNIRLYDLLAGLLVRHNRDQDLAPLISVVQLAIGSLDSKLQDMPDPEEKQRAELEQQSKSRKKRQRRYAQNELKRKSKLQNARKALEKRLAAWTSESGKWQAKWRAQSPLKWNGVDI